VSEFGLGLIQSSKIFFLSIRDRSILLGLMFLMQLLSTTDARFRCSFLSSVTSMVLDTLICSLASTHVTVSRRTQRTLPTNLSKNAVFWSVAPCRYCVNRRFGGTYRLHLQGRKIRERGISLSRWLRTPAHAGSSLADFFTLKMKEIRSSETSVHTRSTWRHMPEDSILHSHRCENLKSYNTSFDYLNFTTY
jgi:hypothetical protein